MKSNSADYDDLIRGLAKGSKARPRIRGRKREMDFVCKKSIDFTDEMWQIVLQRVEQTNGNTRTVVYEGLELLAAKYGCKKR